MCLFYDYDMFSTHTLVIATYAWDWYHRSLSLSQCQYQDTSNQTTTLQGRARWGTDWAILRLIYQYSNIYIQNYGTVNRGNFAHPGNFVRNLRNVWEVHMSFSWAKLLIDCDIISLGNCNRLPFNRDIYLFIYLQFWTLFYVKYLPGPSSNTHLHGLLKKFKEIAVWRACMFSKFDLHD